MPSRFGVAVILLFWAATTAAVVRRDILPRYFADGPPAISIEMTDEATAQVPARWSLYRELPEGPKKIGGLSSWLEYVPTDDTFWFHTEYRDLKFDMGRFAAGELRIELPKVESDVRVTRAGLLREQRFTADMEAVLVVPLPGVAPVRQTLAGATADVSGTVTNGVLTGECRAWYPRRVPSGPWPPPTFTRPLEPTPVTDGQVLNPMMPLARLKNVRGGQRWVIREVDPLKEAIGTLVQEAMKNGGEAKLLGLSGSSGPRELIAVVRSEPETVVPRRMQTLGKAADPVECWVIDYRGDGDVRAATWVAVSDGRVLRQEAAGFGEKLRFERED